MSDLVATPVEVNINGAEYVLSPNTIADYAKMRQCWQTAQIEAALLAIPLDDTETRREAIKIGLERGAETWVAWTLTKEGFTYACYLGIRRNHPKLTWPQFCEQIKDDPESQMKLEDKYAIANPSAGDPATNGSDAAENPTT